MNIFKNKDVVDALTMIGFCIMLGAIIGSVFKYWPLPVNGSVFVENSLQK